MSFYKYLLRAHVRTHIRRCTTYVRSGRDRGRREGDISPLDTHYSGTALKEMVRGDRREERRGEGKGAGEGRGGEERDRGSGGGGEEGMIREERRHETWKRRGGNMPFNNFDGNQMSLMGMADSSGA